VTDAHTHTPAGVARIPTAPNRATLTLHQVADLYFAAYRGKDSTRVLYVDHWLQVIGDRQLACFRAKYSISCSCAETTVVLQRNPTIVSRPRLPLAFAISRLQVIGSNYMHR
jgi:hypothetical protein